MPPLPLLPLPLGQAVRHDGKDGILVRIHGTQSPETCVSMRDYIFHGGKAEFDFVWQDGTETLRVCEARVRKCPLWQIFDGEVCSAEDVAAAIAYAKDGVAQRQVETTSAEPKTPDAKPKTPPSPALRFSMASAICQRLGIEFKSYGQVPFPDDADDLGTHVDRCLCAVAVPADCNEVTGLTAYEGSAFIGQGKPPRFEPVFAAAAAPAAAVADRRVAPPAEKKVRAKKGKAPLSAIVGEINARNAPPGGWDDSDKVEKTEPAKPVESGKQESRTEEQMVARRFSFENLIKKVPDTMLAYLATQAKQPDTDGKSVRAAFIEWVAGSSFDGTDWRKAWEAFAAARSRRGDEAEAAPVEPAAIIPPAAPAMLPKSFKAEFLVDGKWATNALRFATKAEAEASVSELMSRWYVPEEGRAAESEDPVSHTFDFAAYRNVPVAEAAPAMPAAIIPTAAAVAAAPAPAPVKPAATKPKPAADVLESMRPWLGRSQYRAVLQLVRSEEGDWYKAKLAELLATIEAMPKTYEQDRPGSEASVHLHYFTGGADWFIIEKDKGSKDDKPADFQSQAFGLADIFQDGGELGYISLPEIIANGAELDFHWAPKTLAEVRRSRSRRGDEAEAAPDDDAPIDNVIQFPAAAIPLVQMPPMATVLDDEPAAVAIPNWLQRLRRTRPM